MITGHCIVNDVNYNEKDIIDVDRLIENCSNSEKKKTPTDHYKNKHSEDWIDGLTNRFGKNVPNCFSCKLGENVVRKVATKMTVPMCLHSFRYEIKEMTFEAPWPNWATDSEALKKLLLERKMRHKYRLEGPSKQVYQNVKNLWD